MCLIVLDGVQAAAQVLLYSMKWPLPGPCFDLTAQILSLAMMQGCIGFVIDLDGVQVTGQVPLDVMKWPAPGPCVDLTSQISSLM